MKTIDTQELKNRIDKGLLPIFDVRGDVIFEQAHIPGAKTAPLGSLVFRVARLMNPESFIVIYSGGNGCTLAADAVERLENLGLKNVHCYEEGAAGWEAAGYELVPSVNAKVHTHGEFQNCRPIVVDRENAYGGAFSSKPVEVGGAGG